jgi:integrase
LAVVTLDGRDHYLGPYDSDESRAKYHRLVAEWLAADRRLPSLGGRSEGLTIDELIEQYWDFANGYYVRDGQPARSVSNIKDALRHVRKLYGRTEASAFGPTALKAVRAGMIDAGLARKTINGRIGIIRRMFRWAAGEELIPAAMYQALQAVSGLTAGRSGARETGPVRPVEEPAFQAILPYLSRTVAAMVQVQWLTAARPGEVVTMRVRELDRSGKDWVYRPTEHKTAHHDRVRAIQIGPRARAILAPFLEKASPDDYVFSPQAALRAQNQARRNARQTPLTPSQRARQAKRNPRRAPGEFYLKNAYRSAIWRACDKAFPHPTLSKHKSADLTEEQRAELSVWRKSHRWSPNRLRHAAATRIRKAFDLEAAQVVLGHARADVTQVYAERDLSRAVEVMRQIG